ALEPDVAAALVPDRRAADQAVGDEQTVVVMHQADQPPQPALGIVNRVVDDPAVPGVVCQDTVLWRASGKAVPHDAAGAVDRAPLGPVGVAQTDAGVAVDDEIPLHDAALRVVPEEHRPARLSGTAVDAHKHVVADDPVVGEHHIDAADVV